MAARPPQRHEPSVWQKSAMGAMLGGGVGLTIGFIFGSFTILRQGAGPRGFVATLSQYMLTSAATFSFFLSIGSVIRTEERRLISPHLESQMRVIPPLIACSPSAIAGATMRARWQEHQRRSAN
ncbi:reactive mitochondrial oxygen species modulator 1-domain-containing protein [Auriculariales sp. MPI-PUGE-AT-0066]|nr:reactive mitochondrial oxygen species modulator 1-domain-containing protein [Auriculariales sp. MPI-PUGE-AT-0066]